MCLNCLEELHWYSKFVIFMCYLEQISNVGIEKIEDGLDRTLEKESSKSESVL